MRAIVENLAHQILSEGAWLAAGGHSLKPIDPSGNALSRDGDTGTAVKADVTGSGRSGRKWL